METICFSKTLVSTYRSTNQKTNINIFTTVRTQNLRKIKSKRMRQAGHAAHTGEMRNLYKVLVGKPEGKRPLGRPRHR
jgi:hypothetical protein